MPYADKEKGLAYLKAYNAKRKDSQKEYNKKYKESNRERIIKNGNTWAKNNPIVVKNYVLKRRYGATVQKYNELLENQKGCCAICKIHYSEFERAFHIDHCHKSNKIRGLLCVNCNTALGHFKEDVNLLEQAGKDSCFLNTDSKKGLAKFRSDINHLQSAIKYLSLNSE